MINLTPNSNAPALHGEPVDFKTIRRALRKPCEHENLDAFISAGWTAAEIAEMSRSFLRGKKTKPTAAEYRLTLAVFRPDDCLAKAHFKHFREPGFVLPPLDRPWPLREDDRRNPMHTPDDHELVEHLARLMMARWDAEGIGKHRGPNARVTDATWSKAYRALCDYGTLGEAIRRLRLEKYM